MRGALGMDICESAHEIIQAGNRERMENLDKLLRLCESPVEQILLAAVFDRWNPDVNPERNRLECYLPAHYPDWDGIFMLYCEPQKVIKLCLFDNTYRADLYFYISRYRRSKQERYPELAHLVVEVDGHDFHDRTKRQASYDRKRDRELTLNGYPVIRFTGSDVYNDPSWCAEQIDLQINELASKVLADFIARGKLEDLLFGYE
jgi:hypothetical protein